MEKEDRAPATGVIGTILGGIGTAGALAAGGMGLLGGGNGRPNPIVQENANLRAEVSQLKSQQYTDGRVISVIDRLSAVDAQLHAVDDKLERAIAQNAADIAVNRELAKKDLEIATLTVRNETLAMESRLNARIDAVANAGTQTACAVGNLQAVVAGITKTMIPSTVVCTGGTSTT